MPGCHFEYRDVPDADGNVRGRAAVRAEVGSSSFTPWRFSQANCAINSDKASEETLNGTYLPPAPGPQAQSAQIRFMRTLPVSNASRL